MANPDEALKQFQRILGDFAKFLESRGRTSEADTRVKMIDRILKEVLGWPEDGIEREPHVEAGYIDYRLDDLGRVMLAIEAKTVNDAFILPEDSGRRLLSLSGVLQRTKEVWDAISQVRSYCVSDCPIRFAVATNGYCWIIFEAMAVGKNWKQGKAAVFYSPQDIQTHFSEFWNLLSRDSVQRGALPKTFDDAKEPRKQYRVLDGLFNKDMPLMRNRLHAQLSPVIEAFLKDIADTAEMEILESCYVPSRTVQDAVTGLSQAIEVNIPRLLREQGARTVLTGRDHSGEFDAAIESAIKEKDWQIYLLLGGIGSGKSTFIKRYIKLTGAAALNQHAVYFYIDLLATPLDSAALEESWYGQILEGLRQRFSNVVKESKKTFKDIYRRELDPLFETRFKDSGASAETIEQKNAEHIEALRSNVCDYTKRLLQLCKTRGKAVVIFIDNVDQMSPDYQSKLFLLAQKITREVGTTTVLSLREESYFSATTQRVLNAYANCKFMIAAPRFRELIHLRLQYAMKVLMRSDEEIKLLLKNGIRLEKKELLNFLQILEHSIFVKSRNIARFIEAICGGNMRLALEMFNTFLISGTTDVDKMLSIYSREGDYQVAFHEYVKSIMLMERYYYKESDANPMMNVFDCGTERNSSHFTTLRILRYLEAHEAEYSPENRGYVEIQKIINDFEAAFDNAEDFARTADRMVRWKLIEANSRSTATVRGSSHVRITAAGRFYLKFLVSDFCYLDLVLQDTPIDDWIVHKQLLELVKQVDNLAGKQSETRQRLEVRFTRVGAFLDYLRKEESRELEELRRNGGSPRFDCNFTDSIEKEFCERRSYIQKRLEENRDKVTEIADDEKIIVPELFDVNAFDAETEEATKPNQAPPAPRKWS
jgi:hypothetical protein